MHDVRLLSVKHFTFRLIYRTRGLWACISGVWIFKFRVAEFWISVEKWVRANGMHCTCARRIIFRALVYWAHHTVVLAIAWHLVNRYLVVCTADPLTRTVTPNSPTTTASESTSLSPDVTSSTQPGKCDPGIHPTSTNLYKYTVHVCARKLNLYW